jgi:hypothetical protein
MWASLVEHIVRKGDALNPTRQFPSAGSIGSAVVTSGQDSAGEVRQEGLSYLGKMRRPRATGVPQRCLMASSPVGGRLRGTSGCMGRPGVPQDVGLRAWDVTLVTAWDSTI